MYIKALLHLKLYLKRNYNPVVLKKFVSVPDKSLLQTLLVSSSWMNPTEFEINDTCLPQEPRYRESSLEFLGNDCLLTFIFPSKQCLSLYAIANNVMTQNALIITTVWKICKLLQ